MNCIKRHRKILICIIFVLLLIATELYIVAHKICNDVRLEYEPVQTLTKPKGIIYPDGGTGEVCGLLPQGALRRHEAAGGHRSGLRRESLSAAHG